MKKTIPYIFAIVAVGIAIYFMSRAFSWSDAYALLKTLSWFFFAILIAFSIIISITKASRFFIILRFNSVNVSWLKTVQTFMASEAFTTLPAGEVGRAVLFHKKLHIDMEQIIAPVFLQALIELWSAACLVAMCAFLAGTHWGLWIIGLFAILGVLSIPILIPKKLFIFITYLKSKGLNYGWVEGLLNIMHAMEKLFSERTASVRIMFWLSIIALGIAGQAIGGVLIWYIAQAQGAHLTLLQGAFTAAIGALIQGILTVIPGGLGVTEGGLVAVLTSFSIPWNRSVLITLLYRIVTLPLSIAIALIFLASLYARNLFTIAKNI
jgi:uncharacterized protein (TIRG00374 family)